MQLTSNIKLGAPYKRTAGEGYDVAGVHPRVSLLHVANDQRLLDKSHSLLQICFKSHYSVVLMGNNNGEFLPSWWLKIPLKLSDIVFLRSRDELAGQGNVLADVADHFRWYFDLLRLKNCQEWK